MTLHHPEAMGPHEALVAELISAETRGGHLFRTNQRDDFLGWFGGAGHHIDLLTEDADKYGYYWNAKPITKYFNLSFGDECIRGFEELLDQGIDVRVASDNGQWCFASWLLSEDRLTFRGDWLRPGYTFNNPGALPYRWCAE